MNSKLTLLAVAGALACGLSFARPVQQERDPLERIAQLEKDVASLKSEVAALRKASKAPSEGGSQDDALRHDMEQVVRWVQSQSQAAGKLESSLDEAQQKGFTAGINPDSRVALLAGFHELAKALKTPVELKSAPVETAKPAERGVKR